MMNNSVNTTPTTRDWSGRHVVAGLFSTRDAAERAIMDLKNAGFSGSDIGIAMRDRNAQGELVKDTGTHAAEGAVSGAIAGGALGGILGFLIGAGAIAIPGLGPVVAGGLLASAFGLAGGTAVAGAGIGAATAGIVGALVGLGIPDEEARYFERGFNTGGVLVTVKSDTRLAEAATILERNGADTGANLTGMNRPPVADNWTVDANGNQVPRSNL